MTKTCIHYADIIKIQNDTAICMDRVNNDVYSIRLHDEELLDVAKCKHVAIVFMKHSPEESKLIKVEKMGKK